jgi:hypothetical protein
MYVFNVKSAKAQTLFALADQFQVAGDHLVRE